MQFIRAFKSSLGVRGVVDNKAFLVLHPAFHSFNLKVFFRCAPKSCLIYKFRVTKANRKQKKTFKSKILFMIFICSWKK